MTIAPRSKVLLCDDSKLVRMTAKKILSADFDLIMAENGEKGWEYLLADKDIQIVFTDLGMPELDGFGFIKRIRSSDYERIRELPVIVITGAVEDEAVKNQVFELGATDFVTKPFAAMDLKARADAHTNYRKVQAELTHMASLDPLTGALNEQGFIKQLQKDVSFVNRHQETLACFSLSLLNFEKLKKDIGIKKIDTILNKIVAVLKDQLRSEDSIGRKGHASFLVSLPMTRPDGAVKLARRLIAAIQDLNFESQTGSFKFSACIGISSLIKGVKTTEEQILSVAEEALRNAIEIGTGNVQIRKLDGISNEEERKISVDEALATIAKGNAEQLQGSLERLATQLAPLFALFNSEQKKQLQSHNGSLTNPDRSMNPHQK